ncbi:hypothetical protein [Sediminibacterium soli]|uniref:hypothetical protein n=1 Tax=Sediminibacterium soli TaxID=2698829 RepID=UPI00137A656A|nr:hypothetical protein [Sediminibacterium soli]NCI45333.1 hypothetical protein [Sediminibacterium soli]
MRNRVRIGLSVIALCAVMQVTGQKKRDTIFLMREFITEGDSELYHTVFIDIDKRSRYYRRAADFSVDRFGREALKNSLAYLAKNKRKLTRKPVTGLPRKWVPLEWYKNKYYLYHPSDFYGYYRVNITDTAFLDDYGEGLTANKILSFTRQDAKTFAFELTGIEKPQHSLVIHLVDSKKGIAVFEDRFNKGKKQYYLMIDAGKIRQFPVIVNYCKDSKMREFDFDKPDFEKLISGK